MDNYCTEDPTIVACTGEDSGREYDTPATDPAPTPTPQVITTDTYAPDPVVTTPIPAPVQDTIATTEVGTVATPVPSPLAETGVPATGYLAAALVFIVLGKALYTVARKQPRR